MSLFPIPDPPAKNKIDGRHMAVRHEIMRLYRAANNLPAPWTGRQGNALKRLLEANPRWPVDVLLRCVRNRFASEVNLAENPAKWIPHLVDYARGPLDAFGKPKKVDVNQVVEEYWKIKKRSQDSGARSQEK